MQTADYNLFTYYFHYFHNHVLTVNRTSIYTLSDLGVLSNLIGSLSLATEHYSPPTE